MNKRASVFIMFVFLCSHIFCQVQVPQEYMERFSAADLPQNAEILNNAALDTAAHEFLGALCGRALQFVLTNLPEQKNNPDMIKIIEAAVNGIEKAGYKENLDVLWQFFLEYSQTDTGIKILITIGKLGKENHLIINNVNNFLMEQVNLYKMRTKVNYATISACITSILELENVSSFPALFGAARSGFPEVITYEASGAMEVLNPQQYRQFLADVIKNETPAEKLAALKVGFDSMSLSLQERGQLAELALEQSFMPEGFEENINIAALRYASISALASLEPYSVRWMTASGRAVEHYRQVQAGFQSGKIPKGRYIEAIECLGKIGDSDAALALVLNLGLINLNIERTGTYDEEIIVAVIRALGNIRDKSAIDNLLAVTYLPLPYSDYVKTEAREAQKNLKW